MSWQLFHLPLFFKAKKESTFKHAFHNSMWYAPLGHLQLCRAWLNFYINKVWRVGRWCGWQDISMDEGISNNGLFYLLHHSKMSKANQPIHLLHFLWNYICNHTPECIATTNILKHLKNTYNKSTSVVFHQWRLAMND